MLSPTQVFGIVNNESGIHVVYRCHCGEPGVWRTGRASEQASATVSG